MRHLSDIGEDELIRRLVRLAPCPQKPEEGPGDDCAVVDSGKGCLQLLKTDALVENIHFLPDAPARKIGWKAIARVISDFAAMGGTPDRFLVSIAISADRSVSFVEGMYRGMGDCMRAHGGVLVGGETSRVPDGSASVISVAATGRVARRHLVLRSGGEPGDVLMVTGRLGGSLAGRHLDFSPRVEQAAWLVATAKPSAMMDLSDGLAKDLPRMAEASGCGYVVDPEAIPCSRNRTVSQALADGEDFELLFAVRPRKAGKLLGGWKRKFPKLPLTVIGRLVEKGTGMSLQGGWDHFA